MYGRDWDYGHRMGFDYGRHPPEVTLAGSVRERADKRRVEDVIESVSGVREVHNNLHVGIGREQGTTTGATPAPTTSRR